MVVRTGARMGSAIKGAAAKHQSIAYKHTLNVFSAYFDRRDVGAAYVCIAVYSWHSDYPETM
jgi:hypothetical protein